MKNVCFTPFFCVNIYVLIAIIFLIIVFIFTYEQYITSGVKTMLDAEYGSQLQGMSNIIQNQQQYSQQQQGSKTSYLNRIYDILEKPAVTYVPTNSQETSYQQMGFATRDETDEAYNPDGSNRLNVYGRRQVNSSSKYEYYVVDGDTKVPITDTNELYSDDNINVSGLTGDFKLTIYDTESVQYNPNAF